MADDTSPNAPDAPEPDHSEPSEERKAELRTAYQEGTDAGLEPPIPLKTPPARSLVGSQLGDYSLTELLRVGGMAQVYRAEDLALQREVAVKVLAEAHVDDPSFPARFRAEARRVAALSHPHLVPVFQVGEQEVAGQRVLYQVMPLLQGSLRDVLKREGMFPYAEAARLVLQVADGLGAAHAAGMIHRDVKPENILLNAEGQALLADFGIAREVPNAAHGSVLPTQAGWAAGTPSYMAPEQLRRVAIDRRVDVYALGVVLYELLTGRLPFAGETPYEVAAHALQDPITPLSTYTPHLPPALEQVALTALARDPDARFPSVAIFAAALRRAVLRPVPPGRHAQPTREHQARSRLLSGAALPAVRTPLPTGRTRRRQRRWLLVFVAGVLLASVGAAVITLPRMNSTDLGLVGSLPGALGSLPSATGTGAPVASGATGAPTSPAQTPLETTLAGGTPSGMPTTGTTATSIAMTTPTPTGNPVVQPPLQIAPQPLVLTPAGSKTCTATQTVTNTSGQTVGWSWQPGSVAGMHFQIDGQPKVSWPSTTTNTPPGGQDTVVATGDCQHHAGSQTITVNDTQGNQYSFTLTLS